MTDFLDQKRTEITKRLNELKPLVEEYSRLEAAAAALDGVSRSTSPSSAPRRGPGRPRGSTNRKPVAATAARSGTRRRAGRPKGSGTRAVQTVTLVKEQPGITIPELANKMGIKQNYLYRVLPGLAQEGKLTKQGRGWHPGKG